MKKISVVSGLLLLYFTAFSQTALPPIWRASLIRKDSIPVVFTITSARENGKWVLYVLNAGEKIKINDVAITKDSINFSMPTFESSFKTKRNKDGSLVGLWTKGTGGDYQYWPFYAIPGQGFRFMKSQVNAKINVTGKWDVTITRSNGTLRKAVAILQQQNDKLTGSFLTPSGDYRFLEGVVTGDSLKLSTFDGSYALLFYAKIADSQKMVNGVFYSGINGKEKWIAVKNANIPLPSQEQPTRLREGETRLNFSFKDLAGKTVSINDEKFKNKVVIIQIMGSWCSNCLDETKFLNEYYINNRNRGIEVLALAYEYSTDQERSKNSLQKFQQLYKVQYPMLITGATAADENKTEKTVPQLTPIRSFPTTIFLDTKGNLRKIKGSFYGPGTGQYFEDYKKEFYGLVDGLLKEK